MLIDKDRIRQLVPHAGAMCLIDAVVAWDGADIACLSDGHRDPRHPLARDGRLAAVHAFEYGAQAAAIHAGLVAGAAGRAPAMAWLGALREATLGCDRLDAVPVPLAVAATLLLHEAGSAIYRCRVTAAGMMLAEGRITLIQRGAPPR
jgi:predicted hotdog family 3-hydroxylacyl-ACP dehydratase